jgi:hypothetical protein
VSMHRTGDSARAAFQLLAALETYEAATNDMLRAWPDLENYDLSSIHLRRIRCQSACVPQVSVPLIGLLIAREALFDCLLARSETATPLRVATCAQQHRAAISALRANCMELVSVAH